MVRHLGEEGPELDLRAMRLLDYDQIAKLHQLGQPIQLGLALVGPVTEETIGIPRSNAEPLAGP